jgi:methyl-accepting chemotaxis protein
MSSETCEKTQLRETPVRNPAYIDADNDHEGYSEDKKYSEEPENPGYVQEAEVVMAEARYRELEAKLVLFEESISHIHTEMSKMSGQGEFRQLRRDFDVFSKRLRRVLKAEDALSAQALDAAKVPPDVLEITYAKTLNDLYAAMLNIFGDSESSQIVEDARDKVRQFSAGVDFFRFENGIFLVRGLSDAVSSKLVSIKQIHATYIELFKILSQSVPNYSSQDFRSFVETGSREYTVQKVVVHDRSIEKITSQLSGITEELANLTENMQFMAELQNNQLEDTGKHAKGIEDINTLMQNIAKAVNLHTKAIKKLSKTLQESHFPEIASKGASSQAQGLNICGLEESMALKASREELLVISEAVASFRDEVNDTFAHIQQQMLQSMQDAEKIQHVHADILKMREEIEQLSLARDRAGGMHEEKASVGHIEHMVLEELRELGPATLKQLENQLSSRCGLLGFDEISSIVGQMEQAQLLTSFKKGRYTYFTLREMANV